MLGDDQNGTGSASTAKRIVETARRELQTHGYSDLHYARVAEELGITRAAVHHHFPTKLELVRTIIVDYCEFTAIQLRDIDDADLPPAERIKTYVGLYREVLAEDHLRMCPGGMLAVEVENLPKSLGDEVRTFFDLHVDWVRKTLGELWVGKRPSRGDALHLICSLQGALLVARIYSDADCFEAVAAKILERHLAPAG
jgi:TetR/AcrR family transcriptional regulator, transcriptional repressor for nem operon